jgi:hypothetical protein
VRIASGSDREGIKELLRVEVMTAEEKAKRWLEDTVHGYSAADVRSLAKLLKEQARDTRHACAEAVMNLDTLKFPDGFSFVDSRMVDQFIDAVDKTQAHDACMNTKAV